jgi:hypothetical protein
MKSVAVLTTLSAVLSGLILVSTATAQTGRPYPTVVFEDPILTPPTAKTLAERVTQVDAILRVTFRELPRIRFVAVTPLPADLLSRFEPLPVRVITEYDAVVLEVLKSHQKVGVAGEGVRLAQRGGDASWNGVKIHAGQQAQDPERDTEYVVFVTYDPESDRMMLLPFDIYKIGAGGVEAARNNMTYAPQIVGRPLGEVLPLIVRAIHQSR